MLSAVAGCALAGRDLAEAFDVDGDGGQDVLQVGPGLSPVAAVAHAGAAGEFAYGALDAGVCPSHPTPEYQETEVSTGPA